MEKREVKRIIVVFKTHLDIGFTALAADVLHAYREDFIPKAVELAFELNGPGQQRFVWTVGAYMVKNYLQHADPARRERFEEALRLGYVRWHGLACTTHTEVMDARLADYDLSISQILNKRYGVKTIAAKMTDVPGHTVALVPHLAAAGIEYLHLGVNAYSRVPALPRLFRWRRGDAEVVVNYAGNYGEDTLLENGVLLHFAHSHDNVGPPQRQDVEAVYAALAEKYPGVPAAAGTLEDFAREVRALRGGLPVVEEEIGDTWIHGAATDPLKISQYRRLLALKAEWLAAGQLRPDAPEYEVLMENLLLVAEHTWGMDVKLHLMDFTHWTKADFRAARARDAYSVGETASHNRHILLGLMREHGIPPELGMELETHYSDFEASHAEQRAYIDAALRALPDALARQAREAFAFAFPVPTGQRCRVGQPVQVGPWRTTVGTAGQLTRLENAELELDRRVSFGLFEYDTYSGQVADDCYYEYGRDIADNFFWSEPDSGKPGLRYEPTLESGSHRMHVTDVFLDDNCLSIVMEGPHGACEWYGCPRQLAIQHRFGEQCIETTLYWRGKDAIRSPEAAWLHMDLAVPQPSGWRLVKLGQTIDPLRVAPGGARKLHGVEYLVNTGAGTRLRLQSLDAPLVALGAKSLYDNADTYNDPAGGPWFLLHNNRWGTNFKLWFEEDMRFYFETQFEKESGET